MSGRLRAVAKANALALAASGGALLAFCVAAATSWVVERERLAVEMARFGNATAEHVAQLAGDALRRDDRIGLGLTLGRLAERAEVRGIAVHTAEDQPFAVVGATVPPQLSYGSRVMHDGAVVGDVRVALNAASFRPDASRHLVALVVALATALIAFGIGSTVAERLGRSSPSGRRQGEDPGRDAQEQDVAPAPEANGDYAVFANLFGRASMAEDDLGRALHGAIAAAQAVADLYQAEARAVARIGVALIFDGGGEERGIAAACAALLLRQVLNDGAPDRASAFRYGIELLPAGGAESAADQQRLLALLSSLAPSGEIAIGGTAYEVLAPTGRLHVSTLDNPAAQALAATAAPRGVLLGAGDGGEAAAIARQAEDIANALSPP